MQPDHIELTHEEIVWLNSRGGRTWQDVRVDNKGQYILMVAGMGIMEKVYLSDKV